MNMNYAQSNYKNLIYLKDGKLYLFGQFKRELLQLIDDNIYTDTLFIPYEFEHSKPIIYFTVIGSLITETIIFIDEDGYMYGIGKNNYNILGIGENIESTPLIKLNEYKWKYLSNSTNIFNDNISCIRNDGTIWVSGRVREDIFGINTESTSFNITDSFIQIGTDSDWREVRSNESHCLAINDDGELYYRGSALGTELGLTESLYTNFTKVGNKEWKTFAEPALHYYIDINDNLYYISKHGDTVLNKISTTNLGPQLYTDNVKFIHTQYNNMVIIKNDNSIYSIGDNSNNTLGVDHSNPVTSLTKIQLDIFEDIIGCTSGQDYNNMYLLTESEIYGAGDYMFLGKNITEGKSSIFIMVEFPDTEIVEIVTGNFTIIDQDVYIPKIILNDNLRTLKINKYSSDDIVEVKINDIWTTSPNDIFRVPDGNYSFRVRKSEYFTKLYTTNIRYNNKEYDTDELLELGIYDLNNFKINFPINDEDFKIFDKSTGEYLDDIFAEIVLIYNDPQTNIDANDAIIEYDSQPYPEIITINSQIASYYSNILVGMSTQYGLISAILDINFHNVLSNLSNITINICLLLIEYINDYDKITIKCTNSTLPYRREIIREFNMETDSGTFYNIIQLLEIKGDSILIEAYNENNVKVAEETILLSDTLNEITI